MIGNIYQKRDISVGVVRIVMKTILVAHINFIVIYLLLSIESIYQGLLYFMILWIEATDDLSEDIGRTNFGQLLQVLQFLLSTSLYV